MIEKHKKGSEARLNCVEYLLEDYRILMKLDPETSENYRINSLDSFADAEYAFMQSLITLLIRRGKTFCVTGKGYFGIAEGRAKFGDEVCFVFGVCVPLVLRSVGKMDRGKNEGGGTLELVRILFLFDREWWLGGGGVGWKVVVELVEILWCTVNLVITRSGSYLELLDKSRREPEYLLSWCIIDPPKAF
jgi:hypothetical protein